MCNKCTPILVGLTSPILKILFLFGCFQKRPIFLLSHGCQKFNQLELIQKNIQVGVNFKYMYINFAGCGLPVSEILIPPTSRNGFLQVGMEFMQVNSCK